MTNFLTQKYGPLPAWAYGAGAGGIVLVLLLVKKHSAKAAPAADDSTAPKGNSTFGGGTIGLINPVQQQSTDKVMHKKHDHTTTPPAVTPNPVADPSQPDPTWADAIGSIGRISGYNKANVTDYQQNVINMMHEAMDEGANINNMSATQYYLTQADPTIKAIAKAILNLPGFVAGTLSSAHGQSATAFNQIPDDKTVMYGQYGTLSK